MYILFCVCFIAFAQSSIPKLIVQTGPNDPARDFQGFPERIQEKNSDFEYRFFTDESALDFIMENFPETELLELYLNPKIKTVMKTDLFRLAAISVLGGFYLDMDVYAYRNMQPLLSNSAVFPKEWWKDDAAFEERHENVPEDDEEHWQMGNYAFGAEAGHPLVQDALAESLRRLKTLLDSVSDSADITDFQVLKTTGPYMLSEIYHKGRKEGKYGDVNFLEGGNEIPVYKHSHGATNWHKFGHFGEHAIKHTWVRRRLATDQELADILYSADNDIWHDGKWALAAVRALRKKSGTFEESETGDNWDAPTITDADLDYAKAILQQHHVSVIDMGIAVGGDVYNDESKEKKALEKRIEEIKRKNKLEKDQKKAQKEAKKQETNEPRTFMSTKVQFFGSKCGGLKSNRPCAADLICEGVTKGKEIGKCGAYSTCICKYPPKDTESSLSAVTGKLDGTRTKSKKKQRSNGIHWEWEVGAFIERAPLDARIIIIAGIFMTVSIIVYFCMCKKSTSLDEERLHLLGEQDVEAEF